MITIDPVYISRDPSKISRWRFSKEPKDSSASRGASGWRWTDHQEPWPVESHVSKDMLGAGIEPYFWYV